jgi:hypothetical protein
VNPSGNSAYIEPVTSQGASVTNSTYFARSVLLSTNSNTTITWMGTNGDASAEKFRRARIHLRPSSELEAEIESRGYSYNVGQSPESIGRAKDIVLDLDNLSYRIVVSRGGDAAG